MAVKARIVLYILVYATVTYSQEYCNINDARSDYNRKYKTCIQGYTNGECNDCYCRSVLQWKNSQSSSIYVEDDCTEKQFKQSMGVGNVVIRRWSTYVIDLPKILIGCFTTIHLSFQDKDHNLIGGVHLTQCNYFPRDHPALTLYPVNVQTNPSYFIRITYDLKAPYRMTADDYNYLKGTHRNFYETNCMDGSPDIEANRCSEAVTGINCDSGNRNVDRQYTNLRKLIGTIWIYEDCAMTCNELRQFTKQIYYTDPPFHYVHVIHKHPTLTLNCVYAPERWGQINTDGTYTPGSGSPSPGPYYPPPPPPTTRSTTTRKTTTTTVSTTKRTTTSSTTPTTTTTTVTTTTKPPTSTVSAAPGTDYENNHEFSCKLSDLQCHEYIGAGMNTLRTPGQATTWLLIEGSFKSYHQLNFHMWPFTTCQTVHVCSGSLENINCSPQSSLLYDTMQKTLLANGKTYLYDLPGVVLTPVDSSSGKYYFPYYTSLAIGKVSIPQRGTVQLGESITILTSSPSCNVFVNREIGSISHVIHTKTCHVIDHEFKSMAGAGYRSKKYNGLILDATMSKAVSIESNLCDNLFDFAPNDGDPSDTVESRAGEPVFIAYDLSLNSNPRCALKIQDGMFITSFALTIAEPKVCKWIRLCFKDSANPGVCTQPARNLDILPIMNIYIPTDTDNAQNFGVGIDELKYITFQLFDINPSPSANNVTMRMHYGVVDSHQKSIIEDMLLDLNFTDTMTLYLAYSAGCAASLEEHTENIFKYVDVNQCLSISGCSRLQYIP